MFALLGSVGVLEFEAIRQHRSQPVPSAAMYIGIAAVAVAAARWVLSTNARVVVVSREALRIESNTARQSWSLGPSDVKSFRLAEDNRSKGVLLIAVLRDGSIRKLEMPEEMIRPFRA